MNITGVLIDTDNITFEVEAEYDYQPYEAPEGEKGYSMGYPGCSAAVEGIYDIVATENNDQFQKLLEDKDTLKYVEDQIESAIWESFNE